MSCLPSTNVFSQISPRRFCSLGESSSHRAAENSNYNLSASHSSSCRLLPWFLVLCGQASNWSSGGSDPQLGHWSDSLVQYIITESFHVLGTRASYLTSLKYNFLIFQVVKIIPSWKCASEWDITCGKFQANSFPLLEVIWQYLVYFKEFTNFINFAK